MGFQPNTKLHYVLYGAGAKKSALHSPRQKGPLTDSLFIQRPDRHAMLMSPNKDETAVHGCHCQGDMTVRMRQVLNRRWVGMRVSLAVNSCLARFTD